MTYVVKTVRLRDVSPALDGLKAQIRDIEGCDVEGLVEVSWLNGAFIAEGTLFVKSSCTVDCRPDVPEDELGTTNPYGRYQYSEVWSDGRNSLTWAVYDDAIVVDITHQSTGNVFYNTTFFGESRRQALEEIERLRQTAEAEPIDFSFVGERIRRGEKR